MLQPSNGKNIKIRKGNPLDEPMFVWTPITPTPMEGYTLKIVEIIGEQSADNAMKTNKPYFIQDNINSTSFQYPVSAKQLEDGKKYAWQVSTNGNTGYKTTYYLLIKRN